MTTPRLQLAHITKRYPAVVASRQWPQVAAKHAETLNACGPDVRLRLAGAVGVEAGTHRTEAAA